MECVRLNERSEGNAGLEGSHKHMPATGMRFRREAITWLQSLNLLQQDLGSRRSTAGISGANACILFNS